MSVYSLFCKAFRTLKMTFSRQMNVINLLRTSWLHCYVKNRYSVAPVTALSESSVTSDQESETYSNKLKSLNFSVNSVTLLGTVIGIQTFQMQKHPDRNWILIFLRTQSHRYVNPEDNHLTETSDTDEYDSKFKIAWNSTSNRVHVFSPKLVWALRDVKLGERLLVTGFLSCYRSRKPDGTTQRNCCVTAQRIAYMGWSNDYQSSENLEEVLET
ncbi:hypothetical protein Smp_022500 [Schistosoma mansoni]|uniref:hypothetical protein n=1 Tax=Schistosoma mansoni TaxID=6183 RepID=UPI00022DC670|nr:hypothetical protein Smp_022500 [Schistosoma mansoni]|eukprot:XP_018653862.1 hypothetical protein Smp_022500 [Schistosoma mansoni]